MVFAATAPVKGDDAEILCGMPPANPGSITPAKPNASIPSGGSNNIAIGVTVA